MKYPVIFMVLYALLGACKSGTYQYISPTVTTGVYRHGGEAHAGIQVGSAGIAAKGGIALSKNINLNGWAAFFPESDNSYNNREAELSIGYQTDPGEHNRVTSIFLGWANGNTEFDKIGLMSNFNRPFFQVQRAVIDRPFFRTLTQYDAFFGLRVNYLMYNGTRDGAGFDDKLFFYQPYFGASIGRKMVRLEIVQGLSIKNAGEWEEGVRIFPYWGNVGVVLKFRK